MRTTSHGWYARIAGTVATLAGMVVILFNWNRPDYESGFFVGGLLVIGGLLLRIEGAVSARNGSAAKD
ncbi:hypothetical protein Lfu02_11250 [Longispora fulva]|uniref:Uncharacterized protein n=1 Tax=Longispora fulva TaxID=619741 RepID=A0A8J7KNA1_9ACTN|nr:hypothetical protein [Longispora fulva]MBG6135012.1 hypothetical protein [Longispora fulva]GIG56753.1 hypothetical protein Lfu02_11250 [Longispora fulva]